MSKKKKNKGGRPSKLTNFTVQKLKEAFAIGASVEEACYYAEINKTSYYSWIKQNEELFNEFERLKEKPILKARQEVVKGLDGNPEFSLKYLERKKKDEFSLRVENETKHSGNIIVNVMKSSDVEKKKNVDK